MLAMSENMWPFKVGFGSGNSLKSCGAESGEYGERPNFSIDFLGQKLPDNNNMIQDPGIRPNSRLI